MRPKLRKVVPGEPSSSSLSCDARSAGAGNPTRILRVKEVVQRIGVSRTTLWRLERRGDFPARRQISPGAVGWLETEVESWINQRSAKRESGAP
jgi:predicted DNA-binding transcriptional regulator AlpA